MEKLGKKNLFIEVNDKNFILAVGIYDDQLNFKIVEKEIIPSAGIQNGKVVNLESGVDILKKSISIIENKTNYVFDSANIILNQNDFDCINVTGFKKLNGNQILLEDISFILNNLKSKLMEIEKNKTIIHLFNTKYFLDYKTHKNLPIGLFGDFYSHQLTFFLIKKNELNNIALLLSKCNLNVNKVIFKSFTEGIDLINTENKDTFFKIIIFKEKIKLIYFYNSAFCFFQNFNFGSDIILKDISKVCSLEMSKVKKLITEKEFELSNDTDKYLDKKYFENNNFRKISIKLIHDISASRIEEIIKLIFKKNKNLDIYKTGDFSLHIHFEDKDFFNKFNKIFKVYFSDKEVYLKELFKEDVHKSINIFGDLLSKGWVREAIPVISKKESWITRLFSKIFE
tara:strand:+ start:1326 stop:2519 length:1194 start_codon:yes stop_codon:yes gene_type:complete